MVNFKWFKSQRKPLACNCSSMYAYALWDGGVLIGVRACMLSCVIEEIIRT